MTKKAREGQHFRYCNDSNLPANQHDSGSGKGQKITLCRFCCDYICQRFVQLWERQNTSAICITKTKPSTCDLPSRLLMFFLNFYWLIIWYIKLVSCQNLDTFRGAVFRKQKHQCRFSISLPCLAHRLSLCSPTALFVPLTMRTCLQATAFVGWLAEIEWEWGGGRKQILSEKFGEFLKPLCYLLSDLKNNLKWIIYLLSWH